MGDILKIKNLSEVFKIMGLEPPKHPLIAFIDFSRTNLTKEVPPSKVLSEFYQISLKGEENCNMRYGRENYDYQEGSLVYTSPGQIMEYEEKINIPITSGWILMFHPDLIRTFPLNKKMKEYRFFEYQSNEALHISNKEKQILLSILEKIEIELDSNIDDFSEEVIVTNIELLLNYSKRFYNRQFITRKNFSKNIVERFESLLQEYFESGKQNELGIPSVQYFADKLNFSPNYFSDLIRKATERSVLEHIHYHVIELAKNRLLNSDLSVTEIAYDMGFEYSQYFSRLFKKKVGMSPSQYRKLN